MERLQALEQNWSMLLLLLILRNHSECYRKKDSKGVKGGSRETSLEKVTLVQTEDNDGLDQHGNNRHGEKW